MTIYSEVIIRYYKTTIKSIGSKIIFLLNMKAACTFSLCQPEKNIADIIRHTGLHRNMVTYRIGKIQEILNVNLDDTQTAVSIWVALQVMKHLGR